MGLSRRQVAILVASGMIQAALAALPDTMGDLLQYRVWTRTLAREGLAAAYWPPAAPEDPARFQAPIDYPPLVPYLLWAVGRSLRAVAPAALENDRWLDFLIRLPFCASVLLLALLVFAETRRVAPGAAALALGLVALNPALVFDTAWWGQADALCALLIAAALVALVRGRPEWSCVAIAAAALAKPLAYPFVTLIALETVKRFGPRRALGCLACGLALVGLGFLPFAWVGRLADGLLALVSQVDAMPFVSVNAHNLWWLVGRGTPWTEASVRPLGLVSWTTLSLLLFGAFHAWTLLRLWRSSQPRALYVAAASTALGFFVLATRLHENHLFYALPLLALAGVQSKPVRVVFIALSATLLANMLLHDPFLTHLARPFVPGPQLLLPPRVPPLLDLGDRLAALGYPWIVEELRGETSFAGLLLTLANAQANVLIFVAWLMLAYRGGSFDHSPGALGAWARPRLLLACALGFVLASGVPFISHALRFQQEHAGSLSGR